MHPYGSLADDYFVNLYLNTKMKLPEGRETILNFFERVQKSFPSLQKFYTRENDSFVLEDDKEQGQHRWISLEPQSLCSFYINPPTPEAALQQHQLMLELAPYMLSVSPLECEAMDYVVGFDFNYNGNHDALVAEALGTGFALEPLADIEDSHVLKYEPAITISLDETCHLQAFLLIETRTTPYQVKREEYMDDPISVFFRVRKFGSLQVDDSFPDTLRLLKHHSDELLGSYVVEQILRPLAQAIATK